MITDRDRAIKVLKQCSFYKAFVVNLTNRRKDIDAFLEWEGIDGFIYCAFSWSETEEGRDFWNHISDCWHRFVNDEDISHLSEWYDKGGVRMETRGGSRRLNFRI